MGEVCAMESSGGEVVKGFDEVQMCIFERRVSIKWLARSGSEKVEEAGDELVGLLK